MRIVIDLQGAQTSNAQRGIGRYSLALSKEIARLRGEHEVMLALNGLFTDTIEPIRAAFAELLPEENILVWEAVGPVKAIDTSCEARRQAAEMTREGFIASLCPDILLTTSLFEGLVDDAITSIGAFSTRVTTAVVLYDLIPLIHRGIYLQNKTLENWYLNKLDHLRRADLLLSISASSGQEAVDYLGFTPKNVVNISTACDSHFKPMTVTETRRVYINKTYGLVRQFVMYTGGIDHRKNIEGLIRAYASLPTHIREAHQLAVVCSIQALDRERLQKLAKEQGLGDKDLVITGFVSEDDLVTLYNLCKLFVFPSWHEGFGLPALEAMACGRAVVGANTSSVPEVIGREDALFDPLDDDAIAQKIAEVLINDDFRAELECHGLKQAEKFSWEQTARRTLESLEEYVSARKQAISNLDLKVMPRRPRLAYISPLPPVQSGISDYSAELLPELAQHYEIDVVIAQNEVTDPWVSSNCSIRDVAWFRQHANRFDRVLYHFGNSEFHSHMFDLLGDFPGVVVLHDFFLSGIVAHMDVHGHKTNTWARALAYNHGWPALLARYKVKDTTDVVWAYPCNQKVLQQALGVIVHSDYSRRLAKQWYGADAGNDWALIPLLRVPALNTDRSVARQFLGLAERDFVVCSFGHLGPTKLNNRLLAAWQASPLAKEPCCRLVFVGQNNNGDYGAELERNIRSSSTASNIEITGWADIERYQVWLVAADVGVQLRTLSRGETSAAVLDCMNNGLATIVNANGSMADLPSDTVWMLEDEFSDEDLVEALTKLWHDNLRRRALGLNAREMIMTSHQPRRCAEMYNQAIECFYRNTSDGLPVLVDSLANLEPPLVSGDWPSVATALADNFPPRLRRKQMILDISELVQRDSKSGIQRVVRSLLMEFLLNPPEEWAVEPVYATADTPGYRYARRFTSRFLGVYDGWGEDELVETYSGDIFIGIDLQPVVVPAQSEQLHSWRRRGIKVFFVVYDMLPLLLNKAFPDVAYGMHQRWLATVSQFDGAVCISRAVADELYNWLQTFGSARVRPFGLNWFHLGADVDNSVPSRGIPTDAEQVLNAMNALPSFLMVGTVEPRKGHAQALAAFEDIWRTGVEANLIIVGKQGWMVEELVEKLRNHPEINKHLFWLEGISDEYLEMIYAASTCLIAASEGEGFGLPLIEATQHKLPIIARDIPVFQEVAGDHAYYFRGFGSVDLADAIRDWLLLNKTGTTPQSEAMSWLTWKESAQELLQALLGGKWYQQWLPDDVHRYWGSDPRLITQVGISEGRDIVSTHKAGYLLYGPYLALSAGMYCVSVWGTLETGCSNNPLVDVTIEEGTQILAESILVTSDQHGLASLEISLDKPCTDLEVRVLVRETDALKISMVTIEPRYEKTEKDLNLPEETEANKFFMTSGAQAMDAE